MPIHDDETVTFKDFTTKRKRVVFKIEPDVFECVPALMPDSLQFIVERFRGEDFSESLKARDMEKVFAGIRDIFQVFLLDDDHYQRFTARLADRKNPIDIHQLTSIIGWIIEVYTNRPTVPSVSSSDGSQPADGGTSSTAGVLEAASGHSSSTHATS